MDCSPPAGHSLTLRRTTAALLFVGCASLLLVAAFFRPGYGLHEAVGWPVCGFKLTTGVPCTTCGMTTAFTYAADGDLLGALRVQPAGAILAVIAAMLAIVSGHALVTGMSLAPLARAIWRPRVIIVGIVIIVAAWIYTTVFTLYTGAWPI